VWRAAAAAGLRPRSARIWSAACSFGEEPYSLAMSLLAHLPPEAGWSHEILATDLSTKALACAQEAIWPMEKAAEVPPSFCRRFMLRGVGSQQGKMKAGPALRQMVRFARVNLKEASYPVTGPFDLIFCRNVLIYFGAEEKKMVIRRLLDHLTPDGILFLGHSETLHGISEGVRSVGPTAYSRSDVWRR
jgi:chemotaxis protein methyltransferase CheR